MSAKHHTPGPWCVAGDPHPKAAHPEARKFAFFANRFIATGPELDDEGSHAVVCSMMDGPEQVANAALISAAPELLEALRELLAERYALEEPEQFDAAGNWTSDSPASVKARAAITKATGGEGGGV